MEKMVAYCGIVCTDCPAYVATRNDDAATLQKVAEAWSREFDAPFTADDCICDGCLSNTRHSAYCRGCQIRVCATERAVTNCAYCDDYGCEKLEEVLVLAPSARQWLEEIRASF